MRLLVRLTGISLFLLLAALGLAATRMLEHEPLVPDSSGMTAEDLQRAHEFLVSSAPGGRVEPGVVAAFTVREQDLKLLLDYMLERLHGGRSSVGMQTDSLSLQLSARLPDNLLGPWLNVQLTLSRQADGLVLERLQLGALTVPARLADALLWRMHELLKARVPEYLAALGAVDDYSMEPGELNILYQWRPELFARLSNRGRELFIGQEARDRLLLHVRNLAALTADPALPRTVPLSALLGPMFAFARQQPGDAVEQNRAVMQAFLMYVTRVDLPMVLGDVPGGLPNMVRRRLTLGGRQDAARHFLISAGLAVSAGTGMAETAGLLKELDDSVEGGSGFSFRDLAANRSGVRFAELAVAGPEQAQGVQNMLAELAEESIFIPDFNDLPERLSEQDFQQAYGDVGSPPYNDLITEIENRISGTPLFQRYN